MVARNARTWFAAITVRKTHGAKISNARQRLSTIIVAAASQQCGRADHRLIGMYRSLEVRRRLGYQKTRDHQPERNCGDCEKALSQRGPRSMVPVIWSGPLEPSGAETGLSGSTPAGCKTDSPISGSNWMSLASFWGTGRPGKLDRWGIKNVGVWTAVLQANFPAATERSVDPD